MRIHKAQIKNFRLLADAELALEEKTTVNVGKEIQIVARDLFGSRLILSQFIDTPEKAAALEGQMTAGGNAE